MLVNCLFSQDDSGVFDPEQQASEELEDTEESDDESVQQPPKKRARGRPALPFSKSGKRSRQKKLDEVYNLCIELSKKYDISFNEILGTTGARWYNGEGGNSDFAEMYQNISQNENPFATKKVSPEKALFVNETCDIGRSTYETLRNTYSEANLPSRHAIEKVKKTLLLPKYDFCNGVRHPLKNVLVESVAETLKAIKFDTSQLSGQPKLKAYFTIGFDGSGSHAQAQGRDIFISTRNCIYGIVSLRRILLTESNDLVYEEKSQAPETGSPVILVPGKETEELVRKIWATLDREAENNQIIDIPSEHGDFQVEIEYMPANDLKVVKTSTGLTGAPCARCPASISDIKNPIKIADGFPIVNNVKVINELFDELVDADGNIPTRRGDILIRRGLKHKPMTTFLDLCDVDPVLHFILHELGSYEKILYHYNSRDSFEGGVPVMSQGKPKGKAASLAIQRAKIDFIENAKELLGLIFDCPDPSGFGGSSDNGNKAKAFLAYENVDKVLLLWDTHGDVTMEENIRICLKNSHVISRILNCTQKVAVDDFILFCTKAYLHRVNTFPWATIPDSIHNGYSHSPQKMKKIGGYGLGTRSEIVLESSMKVLRRLMRYHSRTTCVKDKLTDVMNHLWLKNHPFFRITLKKPAPVKPVKATVKNPYDTIVDEFILQ